MENNNRRWTDGLTPDLFLTLAFMENDNRRWTDGLTTELLKAEKLAEDGKRLVLKAVASRTPIGQIPLERSDESAEDREEVRNGARQEVARIANFAIVENPEAEIGTDSPREVTVEEGVKNERVLTPEQEGRILGALQSRFNANTKLHEGINWKDVEASLKASPEALWSLAQMKSARHAPDVYHDDESGYYFGTCSVEAPKSARNCVYDKEAADWLRETRPDVQFNGSAVEMAEAMGITLMLPEHYRDILQEKGKFDKKTWSWLLTQSDTRSNGFAPVGNRNGDIVLVFQYNAYFCTVNRGWRGSLRVKKVKAVGKATAECAFNQKALN